MDNVNLIYYEYNYKKTMLKYENLAKRLENELAYHRYVDGGLVFQCRILNEFSPAEVFKINYMLRMMNSDCEIREDNKGLIFVDRVGKENVRKLIEKYKKMKLRQNIINGISMILLVVIVFNFIK